MRVLVIEDNVRLAEHITVAVLNAGFACDAAHSLSEASDALAAGAAGLIILDLGLPDGSGLDWLKKLRASGDTVPVLILTARDGLGDRVNGLDAGADDYLIKPFEVDELLARCRALMRRPSTSLGTVLMLGNIGLQQSDRTVVISGQTVDLGKRETGILECLMRRPGGVVTRDVLEQQAYSLGDEITPNAVEAAISRLRRKLADAGATADIQTVRGVGYIITGS
jgi:DNA-binding response OmpR family regulator